MQLHQYLPENILELFYINAVMHKKSFHYTYVGRITIVQFDIAKIRYITQEKCAKHRRA